MAQKRICRPTSAKGLCQSLELTQLSNFSVNAFKLEFVMMRSATDEKWLLKLLQFGWYKS
jgi:hypothetical protein